MLINYLNGQTSLKGLNWDLSAKSVHNENFYYTLRLTTAREFLQCKSRENILFNPTLSLGRCVNQRVNRSGNNDKRRNLRQRKTTM